MFGADVAFSFLRFVVCSLAFMLMSTVMCVGTSREAFEAFFLFKFKLIGL